MSKNGTIVTDVITPFKGTGWFRSSNAETIEASKERFRKNYDAGNFVNDIKPGMDEAQLDKVPVVESCKATPECTIYNYVIPNDLLKDSSKKGKQKKIERRIFNEEQQASKMARINDENNTTIQGKDTTIGNANKSIEDLQAQISGINDENLSNVGSLNTAIQGKDTTIGNANKRIEDLQAQISDLQQSKTWLQNKVKSLQPVDRALSSTSTTGRPTTPYLPDLLSSIANKLTTILRRASPDYVSPSSISHYATLPNAINNYFLFVNKLDTKKYLVGHDMEYVKFYENGSNSKLEYPKAIQFSSIWGRVNYCSISKLEQFYHFITPVDKSETFNFKILFGNINDIRTYFASKFNELFSGTELDFKTNADLNPSESRIRDKITEFNQNYKSLVPFEGFSFSGGTRRRNRKTRRRHATKKHCRKQLKTHRRKGRREKRKLTRRR
jgi:hypothetical protein